MRAAATLVILCSLPFAANAQNQNPDDPQTTATLRLSSNLVVVPTQVETKKGDILFGLKPNQFVVTDNGIPQKIRVDEDTDALGLSLVVVVQCSGAAYAQFDSMRGLASMVDDFTGGAPRQIALVSYGDEPDLLSPFIADQDKLADAFSQLAPCQDKNVATLDAVNYAIHLFDSPDGALTPLAAHYRRAILLVSETHDHGSRVKPQTVIANLGRTNTVVDSVSFEPGRESILDSLLHGAMGPGPLGLILTAVEAVKKNVPHALSEFSGGEYTVFSSQKKFDRGVNALANHIHNFYQISYIPAPDAAPGLHHIQVKVPDYSDARILYRETWYAGDQPPPELPGRDKKK